MFAKIDISSFESERDNRVEEKIRKKEKWKSLANKYSYYDFTDGNYWETRIYRYKLCHRLYKKPGKSHVRTLHFYIVRETKKSKKKIIKTMQPGSFFGHDITMYYNEEGGEDLKEFFNEWYNWEKIK